MKIDGIQHRLIKRGEIIRSTDVFNNGHKVESYNVGQPNIDDKPYYRLYRKIKSKKA